MLEATLSVVQGTQTPSGTVTFLSNGEVLGSTSLTGGMVAQYSTSALAVGTDSVTAVYSGDANHNGATASAVAVTVQTLVSPRQ